MKQLPERANLDQLKNQAKTLLRAARAKDPEALRRFQVVPAVARIDPAEALNPALHDAQFVIAREYGFRSWKELREHVEEQSLGFTAAVEEFIRCATGNAPDRAFRLLARYPTIAHASLQCELVLGDAQAVGTKLREHPGLGAQPGGIQNWGPLLYICHTSLHPDGAERVAGVVGIARELLGRGA